MKKAKVWAELATVLLAAVFLTGGLCEDLGTITFTIDQETDEVEVDLDQAFADALDAGLIEGWDEVPDGTCITLKDELTVYPDPTDIDLQDNSSEGKTVKKYRGHIKSITVDELKYIITENSLSFDVPKVELYIGEYGAAKEDLQWVATIPGIKKGETGEHEIAVTDELTKVLGDVLMSDMKFSFTMKATYGGDVCKNQQLGKITLKAKVVITVEAEAI